MDLAYKAPTGLEFGRFRIFPHRRELLADGMPVELGGRAFDVLMALIEARGAVLSKGALRARVWPDRIVEENALQSQISALRAALGADRDLIRTLSGRGYQFIGEIRVLSAGPDERLAGGTSEPAAGSAPTNLPEPASELIGRDDAVSEVLGLAGGQRLVALTGAGGIGKTRLALAVARRLLPRFPGGVWLVDFSPIVDPGLVPAAVAAAVRLELGAVEVSVQRVAQALADRELLLVLDTCEHVIAVAAALAEAVLRAGPSACLIATSRERLEVEGEWVYPVLPLSVPVEAAEEQDEFLRCGAVQLFVERARAANPRFAPDRRALTQIAVICRRLDGIPLAIEMAAARTFTYPVDEIVTLLNDRFQLLTAGRRTALPRHQTLRAAFDWSYELLPETERVILRRLAIFAGSFSRDAATTVVARLPEVTPREVIEGLSSLVATSLVVAEISHFRTRFRLLDTTRAYALEKLDASGERERLAGGHAEYYRALFEQAEAEWETRPANEWLAEYGRAIDNLRAALDWAFSPKGDPAIGVAATAAAVPLWMDLLLLEECRSRVEQALGALTTGANPDALGEMKLHAGLGATLMATRSATDPEVGAAWAKALELAERLDDIQYQLRALFGVWSSHMQRGQHRVALELAQKYSSLATASPDPNDRLIGERLISDAEYLGGNLLSARRQIEHMIADYAVSNRWPIIRRFLIDHLSAARAFLAHILWLQGFADQAMRTADTSIKDARETDHLPSVCYVLAVAACPIALWAGDLDAADHHISMLLDLSKRHALTLWEGWGRCYQGVLLINSGDSGNGSGLLQAGLNALGGAKFGVRLITFLGNVTLALGRAGQIAAGLSEVDKAVRQFGQAKENWWITDLLRSKGELLLLQGAPGAARAAEDLFQEALDWAHRQGMLSLELRAATSLARLLRSQGRLADAMAVLQPVCDRLTEGFATADVIAAKQLLDS